MAYDVTNFSDYVAKENATLTKTLFAGGDTGKFAMKMAGVKGSTKVPHLSGAATLQAGSCASPSGSRVATEVTLSVEPFTVYEDFCQDDLQSKFPNIVIGAGSNNGDSLGSWEGTLVETIMASINETLELTYWQGNTAAGSYQLFDGFIKQIDAAVGTVDGNPTGITAATGITSANVIDIVEGMHTAAPSKVKRDATFSIMVGDDVFDMYIKALKAANLYHYAPEHDNGVYKIGGSAATLYRVYGLDGTDRLFASVGRNFILGADVEDEKDVADVFYDRTTDKMNVRVKAKAGVAVANADEIVEFSLV